MSMRHDIAKALDAVEGVRGLAVPPVSPVRGDAWPVWQITEWATLAGGWITTWDVWVILASADTATTIDDGDPLIDPVGDALAHLGVLVSVAPGRVLAQATTPNAAPALHFILSTAQ